METLGNNTNQVKKKSKINILVHDYESFSIKDF